MFDAVGRTVWSTKKTWTRLPPFRQRTAFVYIILESLAEAA